MSKLGGMDIREMLAKLTPHLEKASAMLAHFPLFSRKPIELEPEERLAVYLRLREMRRKMGLPDPGTDERSQNQDEGINDEGTAFGGDADNDSGGSGDCGDSCDTADRDREGERGEHRESDSGPEPQDV
jgi:hypothetical protein